MYKILLLCLYVFFSDIYVKVLIQTENQLNEYMFRQSPTAYNSSMSCGITRSKNDVKKIMKMI